MGVSPFMETYILYIIFPSWLICSTFQICRERERAPFPFKWCTFPPLRRVRSNHFGECEVTTSEVLHKHDEFTQSTYRDILTMVNPRTLLRLWLWIAPKLSHWSHGMHGACMIDHFIGWSHYAFSFPVPIHRMFIKVLTRIPLVMVDDS